MKAVLSVNDKRLDKIRLTHAMLCVDSRGRPCILDIGHIPALYKVIKIVKIAIVGKTYSEAMIIARRSLAAKLAQGFKLKQKGK